MPNKPATKLRTHLPSLPKPFVDIATSPKKFFTPQEFADYLSVSVRAVYRYISDGKLPAVCPGGGPTRRIQKEDALQFIQRWRGAKPGHVMLPGRFRSPHSSSDPTIQ